MNITFKNLNAQPYLQLLNLFTEGYYLIVNTTHTKWHQLSGSPMICTLLYSKPNQCLNTCSSMVVVAVVMVIPTMHEKSYIESHNAWKFLKKVKKLIHTSLNHNVETDRNHLGIIRPSSNCRTKWPSTLQGSSFLKRYIRNLPQAVFCNLKFETIRHNYFTNMDTFST